MNKNNYNKKGFTLIELLVVLGIFVLLISATTWIFITSLRSTNIIWDQLEAQSDGRSVIKTIVDEARRAEESSTGSFPIDTADDNELIFYANVDSDSKRERVHFWLTSTTLKRGIIKPSGSPLAYNLVDEEIKDLANYVVNIGEGIPLFRYYDEFYSGTSTPLMTPASSTQIQVISVQLKLEKDSSKTPVPLNLESSVQIRNLKSN